MKKLLSLFAGALVFVALLMPVVAGAHEGEHTAPETAKPKTTLQERTKKRTTDTATKLTAAQMAVIKSRCSSVKGVIASVQAKTSAFKTARGNRYQKVYDHLAELGPKLKAAGIDTATYDTQIIELKVHLDDFNKAVDAYKVTVDDLKTMDCSTDPQGFVATVKTGVEQRMTVIEKSQAFRSHIKKNIKPTLVTIRKELATKKTEGQ